MINDIPIRFEKLTYEEVLPLLKDTISDFPHLDNVGVEAYAKKMSEFATFATLRNRDGKIVGIVSFYENFPPNAYITHVWVQKDIRGKGVCGRMIQEIHKRLQNLNFIKIGLEVKIDNTSAFKAYTKLGYGPVTIENSSIKMICDLAQSNNKNE